MKPNMKTKILKLMLGLLTMGISKASFGFDHTHAQWTQILSEVVVPKGLTTQVKYQSVVQNPQPLDDYLKAISDVTKPQYDKFSDNEKLAFLFNAYNAFTVKLIANGLKEKKNLKSIKELGTFITNPWKKKFFNFLGEKSHLDRIEHDIARKSFDEPRLHFAFNCASVGCPALLPTAFKASTLNEQLDKAAKDFLKDSSRNRYDAGKKIFYLSSIFKWYGDDFETSKKLGPLKKFLAEHMELPKDVKANLLAGQGKIDYLDYDWNLNIAK